MYNLTYIILQPICDSSRGSNNWYIDNWVSQKERSTLYQVVEESGIYYYLNLMHTLPKSYYLSLMSSYIIFCCRLIMTIPSIPHGFANYFKVQLQRSPLHRCISPEAILFIPMTMVDTGRQLTMEYVWKAKQISTGSCRRFMKFNSQVWVWNAFSSSVSGTTPSSIEVFGLTRMVLLMSMVDEGTTKKSFFYIHACSEN